MAHHGGAEFGVEEIVAHSEVLRVIPKRGHRVAVVIAHAESCAGEPKKKPERKDRRDAGDAELVQQAGVEGPLLVGVVLSLSQVAAWLRSRRNGCCRCRSACWGYS